MTNTTTVVGNLTRDPELMPGARPRCKLGLAVNRRWQSQGEWQESVSFFNAICWADMAVNVAASLRKGDRVVVVGRFEQRSYETDDGDRRSIIELTADEVAPSLRWASVPEVRRGTRNDDAQPQGDAEPF